jgi:predicted Zn-dependent protease
VNQYCDVFKLVQSASINTIKIKVIQELIQIERPINWTVGCFKESIAEIIRIEKYNLKQNTKKI